MHKYYVWLSICTDEHINPQKMDDVHWAYYNPFISMKWYIIDLNVCFKLLIKDRRVKIESYLENHSFRSVHTSMALTWKTMVDAISSKTEFNNQ